MKKRVFIWLSVLCLFSLSLLAHDIYYYELSNGKGDGHFITITSKSCYDSDSEGVSLDNGLRLFRGTQNNQRVYSGYSAFGDAHYYFSLDYSTLKVVEDKSGKTYNYTRKTASPGAISAHAASGRTIQKPGPMPDPSTPTSVPSPTINGNANSNTTVVTHRPCSGCGGSGVCTMCHGRGIYQNMYDGKIYNCSSCGGTGRCRVCHGKGHCD